MQLSELQRTLKKHPTCPFWVTKSMYRSRVHYDRVFVVDTLEELTPRYEGERKRTLAHGTLYIKVPGALAHVNHRGEYVSDQPPLLSEQKAVVYTKDIYGEVPAHDFTTGEWVHDIEVWKNETLREMWENYTRLVVERDEESRLLERLQSVGIDVSHEDMSLLTHKAQDIINQLLNLERTSA